MVKTMTEGRKTRGETLMVTLRGYLATARGKTPKLPVVLTCANNTNRTRSSSSRSGDEVAAAAVDMNESDEDDEARDECTSLQKSRYW